MTTSEMTIAKTTSQFSTNRKTRIMYSLTSLGVATIAEAISGIIAFYIVDVKNLPVTRYSTFWFFYTLYNALNNPALGYISDRTRTRWGRRRPYLLFGPIPFAIVFMMLWWRPPLQGDISLAIYYAFAYILYDAVVTLVYMPFIALTPEMTSDYDERTSNKLSQGIFLHPG